MTLVWYSIYTYIIYIELRILSQDKETYAETEIPFNDASWAGVARPEALLYVIIKNIKCAFGLFCLYIFMFQFPKVMRLIPKYYLKFNA